MKFKNKISIPIQFKYLLIYSWLILQAEAARPFSSGSTISNFGSGTRNYGSTSSFGSSIGNTRSNFGSGTRNYGSTSSIASSTGNTLSNIVSGTRSYGSTGSVGTSMFKTNYNTGFNSQSNRPLISIADGKTALRSGSNTAQTFPLTNFGFSSLNKQSSYKPTGLSSAPTKPVFSIADGKQNLGSRSNAFTNLNTPTKQPAYNPYFDAGPKVHATKNIDFPPLIQQAANNTEPKTQVSTSKDVNLLPKQPAYNPFFYTGTNVDSNLTATNVGLKAQPKPPPYNPSFLEMNTTQTFPLFLFRTVVNNKFSRVTEIPTSNANNLFANNPTTNIIQIPPIGHFDYLYFTKNDTNATNTKNSNFSTTPLSFHHLKAFNLEHDNQASDNKIPSKYGYQHAKVVHNYIKGNKAILSRPSILGLKGYTIGAAQQLHRLKTQQELNKVLKKHESHNTKNQIIVIVTVVIIIALVGGIILFLKFKK